MGSAVAWRPSSEGRAVFYQRRDGAQGSSVVLSVGPFFFDPSVPFAIAIGDEKAVVAIAFQHEARSDISSSSLGRLKAMGCCTDDPSGWSAPRRCELQPEKIRDGALSYIGSGSKQHNLSASVWAKWLTRGPGINRSQELELFGRAVRESSEAMDEVSRLEGRRVCCHCRLNQRCHGDILIALFRELK